MKGHQRHNRRLTPSEMRARRDSFLLLKAEWDEKLRASGFRDIETWDPTRAEYRPDSLKSDQGHGGSADGIRPDETRAILLRLALEHIDRYPFRHPWERRVCELYCLDGLSIRAIAKHPDITSGEDTRGRKRSTIFNVVDRFLSAVHTSGFRVGGLFSIPRGEGAA